MLMEKIDQTLTSLKSLLGLNSFFFVAFSRSLSIHFPFTCLINLLKWIPNLCRKYAEYFWMHATWRYFLVQAPWHLEGAQSGERLLEALLVSTKGGLAIWRSGISLLTGTHIKIINSCYIPALCWVLHVHFIFTTAYKKESGVIALILRTITPAKFTILPRGTCPSRKLLCELSLANSEPKHFKNYAIYSLTYLALSLVQDKLDEVCCLNYVSGDISITSFSPFPWERLDAWHRWYRTRKRNITGPWKRGFKI